MRASFALSIVLSLAACRTSHLGSCASDAQCPTGAMCDPAQGVCVARAGACLPACDASHLCDSGSLTCVAVQSPQVAITAPAADTMEAGSLQATATARAPGGVSAVSFELRSISGALLATAVGALSPSDAASWSGTLSLAAVVDGPANLTAIATWAQGTAPSAAVSITVHQNACFPACPSGQTCQAGICVAASCTPACSTSQVCVGGACQTATTADVTITSPGSGAFASGTLLTTASAHAPGGVSGVRFDLSIGSTVVATAAGQASGTDPSNFAAAIPLASVADGAASLTATVTYATGSVTSAALPITVDQTAPAISMQTDGRTSLYAATDVDTVVASISDATSGVLDSSVSLAIAGHAPVAGTATSPGVYAFAVTIDDSVAPAGTTTVVPFSITARDRAGNLATLTGDPKEVIRVDRDAPVITAVTYTPPPLVDGSGHLLFGGPAGGTLSLKASITDGAGVATACLRLPGETATCPHAGTFNGTSNTWSFSFPRPAAPQNGTTPFTFTLEASDTLAAHLTGASQAEHQSSSAQTVYFDYAGPSISVAADTTPYARTTVPIPVSAFIADPSGVPDGGVFLNGSLAPSFRDGGLFTFQLNPQNAPAGVEGAYLFQVSASDSFGNAADAGATRVIDGAPPDASVQVFKDVPDGGGVTYPAAVTGTGWDGTQFVYSDTVNVKGTLTDVSGVGSASLHIDGIDVDGGVTAGTPHSLGCDAGVSPCSFNMTIALNAAGNGAFNSRTSIHPMGDISAPSAALSIVIDSTDSARSADGTAAANAGSSSLAAQTTRLLWQMYLPASVSGLGVHPNGDLIVTLDGGADTVVALRPDDGGVHWSWGSDAGTSGAGAIDGTPAIGGGDGGTARVYVAAESGTVYALGPSGAQAWHYAPTGGDTFNVGPAISTATVATVSVDDVIVDGALSKSLSSIYSLTAGTGSTGTLLSSQAVGAANNSSAPLILSGSVYYGTVTTLVSHTLSAAGVLGSAVTGSSVGGFVQTNYYEVITDGSNLFTWRQPNKSTANGFVSVSPDFTTFNWGQAVTPSGAGAVALDLSILVPLASGAVNTFDPNPNGTGANSTLFNLGGAGRAPLVGWDGQAAHEHFYLPRSAAITYAYDSAGNLSWTADPNGTTYRALTMDCSGRLFGASNGVTGSKSLVYALVTDDRGLADTAWPSYRVDARNTGNVTSTSGILKSGGSCAQ